MDITGRKLFVKALQEEGVTTLFGYPGGTVTDLFDELYKQDGIEVVLPRHEQGLIHEAEGYARSTGKVGVCLVTSGPGATNIMTGLADAHYDSIPLVCFTGQVPLSLIGNDAFQEVDIVGMTRSITKYGMTICVTSDDITFEQIKKQLNRMVEVIKVIDLTDVPIHMKEILFAKVLDINAAEKLEVFQIAQVFHVEVSDVGNDSVLLECKLTERRNNELIALLRSKFKRIEVVRGGAVAIESISTSCR